MRRHTCLIHFNLSNKCIMATFRKFLMHKFTEFFFSLNKFRIMNLHSSFYKFALKDWKSHWLRYVKILINIYRDNYAPSCIQFESMESFVIIYIHKHQWWNLMFYCWLNKEDVIICIILLHRVVLGSRFPFSRSP